jgi:hypothetical protein
MPAILKLVGKADTIDYRVSRVATDTEAEEILNKADEFHKLMDSWIARNHSGLMA